MYSFLDINHIFFTVLGYPMSYVEFFGTLFNIWCVWLVAKNKILNWPIGIIGVVLFAALYWQIRLYSDLLEQFYYFVTGFWGWYVWSKGRNGGEELPVTTLKKSAYLMWGSIIMVGTFLLTYLTTHLHLWYPAYFPEVASYATLDAFTTVLSLVATVFMVRKQIENWYLWIFVDIIGIWLYWVKGVHLVSLLYVLFLVIATHGLFTWLKIKRAAQKA
jgi:nicotinamide mononucleotide transporter